MPLYYIETDFGCGIREAKTKKEAWRDLVMAEGENHARSVRLATKDDIAHVRGMGGWIPTDR